LGKRKANTTSDASASEGTCPRGWRPTLKMEFRHLRLSVLTTDLLRTKLSSITSASYLYARVEDYQGGPVASGGSVGDIWTTTTTQEARSDSSQLRAIDATKQRYAPLASHFSISPPPRPRRAAQSPAPTDLSLSLSLSRARARACVCVFYLAVASLDVQLLHHT